MSIIPVVRCSHFATSVAFYTRVLDFTWLDGDREDRPSPVHHGPLDQTWGTREFHVDDPDGDTLRFVQDPGL